jgi:transcriptional regulator with PAS, ATPase and Fis domain
MRAHTLSSLFGLTTTQLIDRLRTSQGHHISLDLNNGTVVCASVEFRRPTLSGEGAWSTDAASVSSRAAPRVQSVQPVQPVQSAKAAPSKLAALDTGDPQVSAVIAKVRKVLGKDIPILITGETGTGKELLAQAIHSDSPRRAGPFVAVNCASIPENLIESELFGYEEGAFTGARRKGATGKLLQANGGTLFLDEIGDMPYPLQVRLLRVLQERVVDPLGSSKSIPVDVAIICATHRNLREMIVQNRFREDLYYRLNGLVVRLPPLRERTDLAVVIETMLQAMPSDELAGAPLCVADDVTTLFEQCAWPGNFRQLGNLLRTAAAMVDEDGEIRREHLPEDFFDDVRSGSVLTPQAAPTANDPLPLHGARLEDVQACAIAAAVARHNGNVSAAARSLGISRNTVYRKMPSLCSADPRGNATRDD